MNKFLITLVALALSWVLLTQLIAPWQIKKRVLSVIPNLKLDSVSVSLFDVSRLTFYGIHATVDQEVKVRSNFQLEKSGNIQLNFNFPVKQAKLTAEVDVFIKNQDLADLNVFFKSNDGGILEGIMQEGIGRVVVDGDELKARVKAIYKDFDARLVSNEDQGGVEVFFTNIGIALTTKEKNKSKKREEVVTKRQPNESIVHFILTGLKEAALEVASSCD